MYKHLCRHIHDRIAVIDNRGKLLLQTFSDAVRQRVAVHFMSFLHACCTECFFCTIDFRRKFPFRDRKNLTIAHVSNKIGIIDYHSFCRFFSQIAELCQHLIGGPEVESRTVFSIFVALPSHKNISVNRRRLILIVSIRSCNYRLAQLVRQRDYLTVDFLQVVITGDTVLLNEKPIVYQRLDFQIVISTCYSFYLLLRLSVQHGTVYLSCLAGTTHQDSLSVGFQHRPWQSWSLVKIVNVRI